jgi:LysM repeat protein
MILDQLYPRKINESLADEFMAMAKARGMTPRLRGTPDQERERTNAMLKQRAADRANAPKPPPIDAETRAHLQDQLKSLEAKFDPNYEYSDDHGFWKEQSSIAQQINRIKAELSRGISESRQRRLNESWLMEDANYRNFKKLGSYIAERRMSEKEILQVFADAEAGMTNKGTGANRTMLGRGKDTAMDFAGGVKDAVTGVLNSIQNSVPVAAVDVAYDQATDAIAGMAGGQKGKVMQAIKGYRNLVKEYPKASGFAKAALVAIAGLATGGAGLPAIAGLTYALDSAIRGDKLSSVIGKGAGAAAVTWGGQKIASMFGGQPAGDEQFAAATDAVDGGSYTIQKGDQLGYIAQANGSTVEQIRAANPTIDFSKPLKPGMEIQLPTAGTPGQGSVWQGYQGNMYGDKAAGPELLGGPAATPTPGPAALGGPAATPMPGPEVSSLAGAGGSTPPISVQTPGGAMRFADQAAYDAWQSGQQLAQVQMPGGAVYSLPQEPIVNPEPVVEPSGSPKPISVQLPGGAMRFADQAAFDAWQNGQQLTQVQMPGGAVYSLPQEPVGGGDTSGVDGATTTSQPALSFADGGTTGTLTLPDGRQVEAYAFPSDGPQPRFGPGSESVKVNYAGQEVTAYIKNGKAYIRNFNPAEFSTPVQESWLPAVKLLKLPADRLIDQKSTVLSWALNESVGRRSRSVNLTTAGTYTVFENVDRYRKAIMEKAGVPGSTRPAFYRPDMPDGPGKKGKPGIIGKGLNWLDKAAGKVGGALSNFGHQFTTNVTKEKLKMNWHQAGKPSDSDALAAFLTKQGVPQDVVTGVYGKMGIPYTPQAEPTTAEPDKAQATEPQATKGGAQRSMPFYGTNPATKKPWTYDELQAKAQAGATPAPTTTEPAAAKTTTQPIGFNATNVMNLPGMQNVKKPAPAKTPNFAGPTGYGKTTMSVKPMTGIPGMKAPATPATPKAPTAPKAPGIKYNINLPAGGGAGVKAAAEPGKLSKDEYIKRIGAPAMPESRVFNALKKPIAEMLSMVETKEDVARIKQFVDQTFVKYGAVSESAFAVRNRLIEHVTQVGAQRRREFARKS